MSGDALTDMFPQLATALLQIFSWLFAAGLLVGGGVWWLQGHGTLRRPRPRAGSPTDPVIEPQARRFLRIGLGLLWLVDGLLQAQPAMPAGFVTHTLTPGISSSPGWLGDLVHPFAEAWAHHPVAADSVTVVVQMGLGLLVLLGGRGLLARSALWASLLWCAAVWVGGEFFGGLLAPGASWLTGAPGAVMVYAIATSLLLVPWDGWSSGDAAKLARRAAGVWMLAAATLQAVPWEGSWSGRGLSAPFEVGAQTSQPTAFLAPITFAADLAATHPVAVNAALVALLLTLGVGLLVSSASGFVTSGIIVCLATWWLAQDFGVLGGLATDPSTGLPLALVLATGWPRSAAPVPESTEPAGGNQRLTDALHGLPVRAGLSTMGVSAVLVAPLLLAGTLLGPPDESAVVADSGGGLIAVPHRTAPEFTLTDQTGSSVSMSKLRGSLTLVTFLDPVCSDDCPIIANQIAAADRALGHLARRIQIVAINTNPIFHRVEDVQAFTRSHGLGDLPNWHFLAGTPEQLGDVLAAYGIAVQVPAAGMVAHGEGIYFVSPDGTTAAYLGDGANPQLSQGYSTLIEQEIRRLLA
jgi:cytochrome oxidase Cu insertion factor (SCO1/SenC/PrrC family)